MLFSCNKKNDDNTIDCTDPNAINYNPEATSIPGSDMAHCMYDTTCTSVINVPFFDINDIPMDTYNIDTAYIVKGNLHTTINYAGGCENHLFCLYKQEVLCVNSACNINFALSHNSNNDGCEAYLIESLCFDISNFLGEENNLYLYVPVSDSYFNIYQF